MASVPGLAAVTLVLLAAAHAVLAQPQTAGHETRPDPPAHGCLQHLRAFGQSMNQDGYWLSGWHPNRTVPSPARAGPWGGVNWPASPDGKLRALYSAANVLAGLGEQETCEAVLAKARALYATSIAELQKRGVQTSSVSKYRRVQIGNATPVAKMKGPYRLSRLTGTDVRNDADEYLGEVEDVIVDPRTGRPSYVLIGTGGFLGIGEEYVGVPWQQLKVTPELGTLILNVTPDLLNKAPKIDPDSFAGAAGLQQQEQVDAYWKRSPRND